MTSAAPPARDDARTPRSGTPRSGARRIAAPRSAAARYGLVVLVWLAAFGLTLALAPWIQRAVFVVFWGAVLFAAWYGRLAAAVIAAVAAVLAVNYFVVPPTYTLRVPTTSDLLTLGIFILVASVVSTLLGARARAQQQLEEYARQLEDQAMELEEQAIELEQQTEEAQALSEELAGSNEQLQRALAAAEGAGHAAGTAREAAQLAGDRARRLLAVTTQLSAATTPEEVADVILREGLSALGADAGSLALVRGDGAGNLEFEVVRTHGYSDELVQGYRRFPVRAGRPLSDALLTRAPQLLESLDDWRVRYPAVVGDMARSGHHAFAAVPVMSGGEVLAGFSVSFREPRAFDDATRTFLASLGEQCGLALARARAAEAEHRALAFNAAMLASIRDGFVALDRDFRYRYANARATELLHVPLDAMLGRTVWETFPGVEATPAGQALQRVQRTRQPEMLESLMPAIGRWMQTRIYPSDDDDGITIFFEDVTERRRAREATAFLAETSALLAASLDYEHTLRAVAEAAVPRLGDWCAVDVVRDPTAAAWPPVVERVAMVHEDGRQLALGADVAARWPTDWSAETGMAAVLRTRTPLFIPHVTDELLVAGARDAEHLAMLRRIGFSSVIVVPLVARGLTLGALTLAMSESGRRYDEQDLALAQDLAQRAATAVDNARLYRTAQAARAEAEAANRAKSQFLSTMSHELRTPLNAIAGYAELLEMGIRGPLTEVQRDDIARIHRSSRVLMSLVNDVLNFARLEAGQVHVQPEAVRLDALLADLETLVIPQVRAKGLHYSHDACSESRVVRADPDRLKQILTNLLTNAVKFTDAGGRVTISCHDGAPVAPGMVRIAVCDTGRGIAAEQLERIFEPFVQVDRHLTLDSQQGVGLGLAISRDLARLMGGELTVESTLGEGSTFALTLPLA